MLTISFKEKYRGVWLFPDMHSALLYACNIATLLKIKLGSLDEHSWVFNYDGATLTINIQAADKKYAFLLKCYKDDKYIETRKFSTRSLATQYVATQLDKLGYEAEEWEPSLGIWRADALKYELYIDPRTCLGDEKYFKLLNISQNSSAADIKQAYHKAALKYHPDKKGGDAKKFKQIKEAYDKLTEKVGKETLGNKARPATLFRSVGNDYSENGFNWEIIDTDYIGSRHDKEIIDATTIQIIKNSLRLLRIKSILPLIISCAILAVCFIWIKNNSWVLRIIGGIAAYIMIIEIIRVTDPYITYLYHASKEGVQIPMSPKIKSWVTKRCIVWLPILLISFLAVFLAAVFLITSAYQTPTTDNVNSPGYYEYK